jgi:branched-chain amino acid transport system permease protein
MPLGEVVRLYVLTGFHLIIYGVVVIIVIMLTPHGLVPWFQNMMKRRAQRQSALSLGE